MYIDILGCDMRLIGLQSPANLVDFKDELTETVARQLLTVCAYV